MTTAYTNSVNKNFLVQNLLLITLLKEQENIRNNTQIAKEMHKTAVVYNLKEFFMNALNKEI